MNNGKLNENTGKRFGEMNDIIVETNDLYKTYRSGNRQVEVLKSIDLVICKGEFVTISGASGVGKSTLLHILGLLDEPTSGKVFFHGSDTKSFNERKRSTLRNRSFGFVFQFFNLLPEFSAVENVLLPALMDKGGSIAQKKQRAQSLLESVGMGHRLTHKPSELSGGEQQRVAIARSLMNSPDVILADEPTGNLDRQSGTEVTNLLRKLNADHNQTIVLVTHNSELARIGSRHLHMADGSFVAV